MKLRHLYRWCVLALVLGSAPLALQAQNAMLITVGADLNQAQRTAVLARLGADKGAEPLTINADETRAALQGIIPVPPGYTAVSSTALTCATPGSGLRVTTENITRVPPAMYVGALATAGLNDVNVMVVAPQEAPAEGLTALAGLFKALEQGVCNAPFDPKRRELAYRQLGVTNDLANALGDPAKAADFVLRAQRVLIRENNNPDAVVPIVGGVELDTGIQLPEPQRQALIVLLASIGQAKPNWGGYAGGWQIQADQTEALLVPQGAAPAPSGPLVGTVSGVNPLKIAVPSVASPFSVNANNVQVTRNGAVATLDQLQVGDTVTISLDGANVARQIAAQSATGGATDGQNVTGLVATIENGTITLNSENGSKQDFKVEGVPVIRDGKAAKLTDIKTNDTVTIQLDANRQPTAVQAVSAGKAASQSSSGGISKWLLPLILLALIGGLLYFLWVRQQQANDTLMPANNSRSAVTTDEDDFNL